MARILVALRLRLLAAQLDTPGRKLGAAAAAFVAGFATAALTLLAVVSGAAPDAPEAGVVAAAGLWLAWILVPLLAPLLGAGLDESLDPAALALLPVRGRQLAPGMLLAGFLGPGAWATAVVVVGLGASHVRSVPGGLLAAVAVVLLAVLCVASGRAAVTVVSRHAGSRRRRDAAVVALAVVAAAVVLGGAPAVLAGGDLATVATVVRWTPGGQLGAALHDLRTDVLGAAALHLLAGAAWVAVVLVGWASALDRALVRAGGDDAGRDTRSTLGALARLLPSPDPRTAAVAAKELLMTARDPIRRSNWLVAWTVGTGGPLYFLLSSDGDPGGGLALVAAFPAFVAAGGVNLNGFGLDGPAVWTQVSSSSTLGPDLRGRVLALVVLNAPPVVLTAVGFALLGGDPAWAVVGTAAGLGVLLAVLGAGSVLSVLAPMPRAGSAMGVSPGTSGRGVLVSASGVLAALAGLAPGIALLVLGRGGWDLGPWLAAPVLLLCGGAVCATGLRHATRLADDRQPELLRAVTRGA